MAPEVKVQVNRRKWTSISAHKLEIERGRCTIPKTAVENRICQQCNCEAVEDEEHLLIYINMNQHYLINLLLKGKLL
jgi:hypothetical protein